MGIIWSCFCKELLLRYAADLSDGPPKFPSSSEDVWVGSVILTEILWEMIHSKSWHKPFQASPKLTIFNFTIMLLGIGISREIWDTLLSTVRRESVMGVHLQSFIGAHGMSNALKIGGNVLHSITAYKWALWGSWGKKTYFKSTWRNVSSLKICHY